MTTTLTPAQRKQLQTIMAAKRITVEKAFTERNGRDVQDGWDVLIAGNWGNRYPTKTIALEAIAADLLKA